MIYTFYSFKGGVGRSMALANIAELLCQRGSNVLIIDFDLEAPGLEKYFDESAQSLTQNISDERGVIDLLISYKEIKSLPNIELPEEYGNANQQEEANEFFYSGEPIENFIVPIYEESNKGGALSLMPAGRRLSKEFTKYANNVRSFDWDDFYKNWDGIKFFEWFKQELYKIADYILIDSRTGFSEISGVCTYLLADTVVMFVAPNQQNLEGTLMLANSLKDTTSESSKNKRSLVIVPSRIDRSEGDPQNRFSDLFNNTFKEFIDTPISSDSLFDELKIPYISYYSYNEKVAVRYPRESIGTDLVNSFNKLTDILQPDYLANNLYEEALSFYKEGLEDEFFASARKAIKIWKELSTKSLRLYGLKLANAKRFLLERYDSKEQSELIVLEVRDTITVYESLYSLSSLALQKEINSILSELSIKLHDIENEEAADIAIDTLIKTLQRQRILIDLLSIDFSEYLVEKAKLASWLYEISNWFIERESLSDAIESIQESVTHYRRLTRVNKTYAVDLAESLITRSECLMGLGENYRAQISATKAVRIYKSLYKTDKETYEYRTANSQIALLDVLALGEINNNNGTLLYVRQAVNFFEEIVEGGAVRFRSDLAKAYNMLSDALFKQQQLDDAVLNQKKAIMIFRELRSSKSSQYELELAYNLLNLSKMLSITGNKQSSKDFAIESKEIFEKLSKHNLSAFLDDIKELDQLIHT